MVPGYGTCDLWGIFHGTVDRSLGLVEVESSRENGLGLGTFGETHPQPQIGTGFMVSLPLYQEHELHRLYK